MRTGRYVISVSGGGVYLRRVVCTIARGKHTTPSGKPELHYHTQRVNENSSKVPRSVRAAVKAVRALIEMKGL